MDGFHTKIADADDVLTAANADVQLALEAAYTLLVAQGVNSTPVIKKTYTDFGNQAGAVAASQLQIRVQATQAPWVNDALSNNGIDINNPQVAGLVNSMIDANFTQDMADAILATGVVTTKTFPSLQLGHLQNAREQRASETV